MTVRSYGHMIIDLPQGCCSQRRFITDPSDLCPETREFSVVIENLNPWIILYRKGDIFPPTKRPDCCAFPVPLSLALPSLSWLSDNSLHSANEGMSYVAATLVTATYCVPLNIHNAPVTGTDPRSVLGNQERAEQNPALDTYQDIDMKKDETRLKRQASFCIKDRKPVVIDNHRVYQPVCRSGCQSLYGSWTNPTTGNVWLVVTNCKRAS